MTYQSLRVVPDPQSGAEPARKSAEIVSLRELAETRAEINRLTKETIRGAFPAPSQHQTCVAAGRMLGCDPDTIERMMAGATKRPDLMLLCGVCRVYADRNKRPAPMALVLAKAMGLRSTSTQPAPARERQKARKGVAA